MHSLRDGFANFWLKNPALLSALHFLIGTALAISPNWIYPLATTLLVLACRRDKILLSLFCFILGFCLSFYRIPHTDVTGNKIEGKGSFSISSLKIYESPFQRSFVYKGTLKEFTSENHHLYDLPCQIYLPLQNNHPKADCDYTLTGTLEQKSPFLFIFKPTKKKAWDPIPQSFSFAEIRFQAKKKLHAYLQSHIKDRSTSTFLNALATGDIDERILSLEFSRLGLQHILAISGFHFAIIALFLGGLLRLFFSYRISSCILLLLLAIYWFFLGNSPSVQRAWIAIGLVLIGKLFHLRTTALNALGVAMWIEILGDPLVIANIGFQLSFLCTLAILMISPMALSACNFPLPKRPLKSVISMSTLDQHGYILSSLVKSSLAINLAVHCVSLPVLLFLFHRFPLMSLAYNFFFPFWVSISLVLLYSALLMTLICPPLGHLIHILNEFWTKSALQVSSNPPAILDFVIRTKELPLFSVILFLTLLFIGAIVWEEKKKTRSLFV